MAWPAYFMTIVIITLDQARVHEMGKTLSYYRHCTDRWRIGYWIIQQHVLRLTFYSWIKCQV